MKNVLKAVAIASMMLCGTAQADVVIDLFSTAQARLEDTTVNGFVQNSQVGGVADATILGGYRELAVDLKSNGGDPDQRASIGVSGITGYLNFNTDSLASATGTVRWDGSTFTASGDAAALSAINPTGLGGLDIGNALTDSFAVDVIFSDAGFTFVIEAYNSASQWSKVSIAANAHLVPATSLIPLAAFLDCGFSDATVTVTCGAGGAVNFDALGALQVIIDPTGTKTSLDLTLNQITVAVPEPSALALIGIALLGAGAATRRRRMS